MSKHKHHAVIQEWINDTSKIVQWRADPLDFWEDATDLEWYEGYEYRIKPEPNPDVTREFKVSLTSFAGVQFTPGQVSIVPPNLRLTFDGETGKLKSAEVL